MTERKKSVSRRFRFVSPMPIDGYCEVLESLRSRNVHRVEKNNAKFQLTLDQVLTLACWFDMDGVQGHFEEKPNKDAYENGAKWEIAHVITGDVNHIPD
jgi:hypothetical protein